MHTMMDKHGAKVLPGKSAGFTLVELLVVISIIALLLSMLMPSLSKVRELGRRTVCLAHQRSIGLSMTAYSIDNRGSLFTRFDESKMAVPDRWANAVPYLWPQARTIETMKPYIGLLQVGYCPSSKYQVKFVTSGSHKDCWEVNLLWLPGLEKASWGRFFDRIPTGAPVNISKAKPNQLLVADRNNFHQGENWGWINHARGAQPATPIDKFLKKIPGGNRMYVDGHGEWVKPQFMGKDNTKPTTNLSTSHYSHLSGGSRPYYW